MKGLLKKFTTILFVGSMLCGLAGCTENENSHKQMGVETNEKNNQKTSEVLNVKAINLTENLTPQTVDINLKWDESTDSMIDFSVKLFQESCVDGKNTLISPLSVIYALGMTANGAEDKTLEEMEAMLGMPVEKMNQYLYQYMKNLPQAENYKLNLANSIWMNENVFEINQDFLQTNMDYYGAEIFQDTFDEHTVQEINDWVKDKTEEMIPEILESVSENAILYLLNALTFDAEWEFMYAEADVDEKSFKMENGEVQDAEIMYSLEKVYLEDENATGFMKYYKDKKYAFVGLLPKETISVAEYVKSLTGKKVMNLLDSAQEEQVVVSLPKFEIEYAIEFSNVLKNMGMKSAFEEENADFAGIGVVEDSENIYISNMLQKTFLSVTEQGTRAGAATAGIFLNGGASKEVTLDRPFVYMIVDCENRIPIFMGTTMSVEY